MKIFIRGILTIVISIVIATTFVHKITYGIALCFGLLFFMIGLVLIGKSYLFVLKLMLCVLFFVPISCLEPYKILVFMNPLTFLGFVLSLKIFHQIYSDQKHGNFKIVIIDKLFILLIISALISTINAAGVMGALNWIMYSIVTGYVVYKAILTLNNNQIVDLLRFIVILCFISVLGGLLEYAFGISIVTGQFSGRYTSLLGGALISALILAGFLPLSFCLYLKERKKIYLITLILMVNAIILTLSRGTWIALLIGNILMIFFLENKFRKRFIIFMTIIIFIGCLTPLKDKIQTRFKTDESQEMSSWGTRRQIFPIAIDILKDNLLFGVGPFNNGRYRKEVVFSRYLRKVSFENSYLGLFVDLGVAGGGILLLICLTSLKEMFFSIRKYTGNYLYKLPIFIGFLIYLINLTTFNFDSYRYFHFISWFFLGTSYQLSKLTHCREAN